MKIHGNAKLSVKGRELLVGRVKNAGWSLTAASRRGGRRQRQSVAGPLG